MTSPSSPLLPPGTPLASEPTTYTQPENDPSTSRPHTHATSTTEIIRPRSPVLSISHQSLLSVCMPSSYLALFSVSGLLQRSASPFYRIICAWAAVGWCAIYILWDAVWTKGATRRRYCYGYIVATLVNAGLVGVVFAMGVEGTRPYANDDKVDLKQGHGEEELMNPIGWSICAVYMTICVLVQGMSVVPLTWRFFAQREEARREMVEACVTK